MFYYYVSLKILSEYASSSIKKQYKNPKKVELTPGFEPGTSSLPRTRSTPEPREQTYFSSEYYLYDWFQDSNKNLPIIFDLHQARVKCSFDDL